MNTMDDQLEIMHFWRGCKHISDLEKLINHCLSRRGTDFLSLFYSTKLESTTVLYMDDRPCLVAIDYRRSAGF